MGIGWVFASDLLLKKLISDNDTVLHLQSVKGSLFVAVTSLFLFLLLRYATARIEQSLRVVERTMAERDKMEDALRKSEERFSLFMQNLPGVAFMKTPEGRYLFANDEWKKVHNFRDDEWRTMLDRDIWPDDIYRKIRSHDEEVVRLRKPVQSIDKVTRQDEEQSWLITKFPIMDEKENSVLIGAVAIDITERRRIEVSLKETNEKLRAVIQASPLAIITINAAGLVRSWNPAAENMFGWKEMEVIGGTLPNIPAEGWKVFVDECQELRHGIGIFLHEGKALRRDGSLIDVSVSSAAMYGTDGKIAGFLALIADISERKKAEEELRQSEEGFRYILKYNPNAIAVLDKELRYIMVSDRFLSDYGLEDHDIIGRGHYDVFPEIPQRWKEIHQRVLAGAVERCDEDPFVRQDGSVDFIWWECRPWFDLRGRIGGIIMYTEVIKGDQKQKL